VPHLHPGLPMEAAEGPHTEMRRSMLLVLAITLHNIPEGLAVGVVFGGAASAVGGDVTHSPSRPAPCSTWSSKSSSPAPSARETRIWRP
jgi:hypothetical protein